MRQWEAANPRPSADEEIKWNAENPSPDQVRADALKAFVDSIQREADAIVLRFSLGKIPSDKAIEEAQALLATARERGLRLPRPA